MNHHLRLWFIFRACTCTEWFECVGDEDDSVTCLTCWVMLLPPLSLPSDPCSLNVTSGRILGLTGSLAHFLKLKVQISSVISLLMSLTRPQTVEGVCCSARGQEQTAPWAEAWGSDRTGDGDLWATGLINLDWWGSGLLDPMHWVIVLIWSHYHFI